MIRTAAAVAALSVAACTSSTSGTTVETVTASHAPASASVNDTVYLSVMQKRFGSMNLSDAWWLGLRRDVCQDFSNGADWVTELAGFIKQGGMPARDAGYAIGAIVRTGCPQFLTLLPQ